MLYEVYIWDDKIICVSLNPYYNGRCSTSYENINYTYYGTECLNPYYNGRYSTSIVKLLKNEESDVLILIIMEDALRELNL